MSLRGERRMDRLALQGNRRQDAPAPRTGALDRLREHIDRQRAEFDRLRRQWRGAELAVQLAPDGPWTAVPEISGGVWAAPAGTPPPFAMSPRGGSQDYAENLHGLSNSPSRHALENHDDTLNRTTLDPNRRPDHA